MNLPASNTSELSFNPPAKNNQRVLAAINEVRAKFDLGLPQIPLKTNVGSAKGKKGKKGQKAKPKPALTSNCRAAAKRRIYEAVHGKPKIEPPKAHPPTERKPKVIAPIKRKTRSSGRDITPVTFTPNPEFKRETRSSTKKAANTATASSGISQVPPSMPSTRSSNAADTPSTMQSFTAINTPQPPASTPATTMSSQTMPTTPPSTKTTPSKRVTRSSKKAATPSSEKAGAPPSEKETTPPSVASATSYDEQGRPRLKIDLKSWKRDQAIKKANSGEGSSKKGEAATTASSSDPKGKRKAEQSTAGPSKKRKTATTNSGADEDDSDDETRRNKKRKAADDESSAPSISEDSDEETDTEAKPPPPKKRKSTTKTAATTITTASAAGPSTSTADPTTLLPTPWHCANRLCNTGQTWHPRDKFGRKAISNFFGRNKNSTKAINDEVWHIYCRKDYQRSSYEGKKKGDTDNERRKRDFQIKNIEMQLQRLQIWRPEALFHVRLVRGVTQGRLAGYHKSIREGLSIDEAEAAAEVKAKKNKKGDVPLSLEDAFPCKLMDEFTGQQNDFCSDGAGVDKSDKNLVYDKTYDDIKQVMAWVKAKIAAGEAQCLPPMEFLINEMGDDEDYTDPNENYHRWCAFEDEVPWTGQKDGDQAGVAAVAGDDVEDDEGEKGDAENDDAESDGAETDDAEVDEGENDEGDDADE